MIDPHLCYSQGDHLLHVHRLWCKGCNLCVDSCTTGILALDAGDLIYVTDIDQCIFCGVCAVRCPDFVFVLKRPPRHATPPALNPTETSCA